MGAGSWQHRRRKQRAVTWRVQSSPSQVTNPRRKWPSGLKAMSFQMNPGISVKPFDFCMLAHLKNILGSKKYFALGCISQTGYLLDCGLGYSAAGGPAWGVPRTDFQGQPRAHSPSLSTPLVSSQFSSSSGGTVSCSCY